MTAGWRQVLAGLLVLVMALAAGGCGHEAAQEPVPAALPAVEPLPKPTGPLAAGASCVTAQCHAALASAKHIHGPVGSGGCDGCHGADTGKHAFPLKRTGNEMCTFCHTVSGTQTHQHQVIKDQGCMSCHEPHVARTKYLLKADTVEHLCISCHEVPLKKHAHEPFAQGQCTACHQPHQSPNAKLLRGGEGAEHCYTCHKDMKTMMAAAPHVHDPAKAACTTCHNPHATDHRAQLREPLVKTCTSCHGGILAKSGGKPHGGAMNTDGCAACHNPHGSAQKELLHARMDKTCMRCHDQPLATADGRTIASLKQALSAKNLHGPVASGSCAECHQIHTTGKPALLRQPFPRTFYAPFDEKSYQLCFSCHDRQLATRERTDSVTGFRDGERNLHFVHVNRSEKGRTCKACHDMHGSDLPKHMTASVPFEGSSWAMPINYEEGANGGTCTPGCHQEARYDRTKAAGSRPASTTQRGTP